MKKKKHGFTLAEVLIALVVIGVVAAMTLPTLIKNINSQKRTAKIQNIEEKLRQGTDLMKVQGRINGFDDTKEFVTELSKYMKITAICDNNNIADCWPGVNATGITVNGNEEKVEVANIDDADWFKLDKNDWYEPVAFLMGDGTPMIITYKKDCFVDENVRGSDSTKCIAGVFDINGGNLPNRYGDKYKDKSTSDIIPINVIGGVGGKYSCVQRIDGLCFTSLPFIPDESLGGCKKLKDTSVDVVGCELEVDRWANAYNKCIEIGGRLPNKQELQKLASYIYNKPITGYKDNIVLDYSKAKLLGFDIAENPAFYVWSMYPLTSTLSLDQYFDPNRTDLYPGGVSRSYGLWSFCVPK